MDPIDAYCRYCRAIPGEECHASQSGLDRDPAGRFHPGRVDAAKRAGDKPARSTT